MKIYKKKSIRKGQNSVKCYQILGKTVLRKEKNDAIKKYAFFGEKWGIFKQKKSELIEGKSVKQAAEPVEGEENFVGDSEIIALGGASNETKDRPLG